MFLFFSKLLPLFVYPVGLSCVLALLAVGLAWRKSRWVPLPAGLLAVVLLVSSNVWASAALVRSLEWRYEPAADPPVADAIVVLGGMLGASPAPGQAFDIGAQGDRALYAAQLYQSGKAPLLVVTGGTLPFFGGKPESRGVAMLLRRLGVPARAIVQDPDSYNTYQNAVNTRRILEERGIERVLLVTSASHMPRAIAVFRKQGIAAIAAPTDFTTWRRGTPPPTAAALALGLLPDAESLGATTRALKEYIGMLAYWLRGWV